MKDFITYIVAAISLLATASGCRQSDDGVQSAALHSLVVLSPDAPSTKAFGEADMMFFQKGDKIGLFIIDALGSEVYSNVAATCNGELIEVWDLEREVLLAGANVLATGYFPYSAGVLPAEIPLVSGARAVNVNDLVYLQQTVNGIDNYELKLENMKHAMTRVKIELRREPSAGGAYVGPGVVTALTIADNKPGGTLIYTAGKLDVTNLTGDPITTGTTAGVVKVSKDYTLTPTFTQVFDILLLPVADLTGESVKLMLEIDGKTLELPFPSDIVAAWPAGQATRYEMTVQNLRVALDKVTAIPWNDAGNANQGVAVGDHADGGIVFWVDPTTPNHHKVVSLYEPPLGILAQAEAYGSGYGAGWRLPDATEVPLLNTALAAVEAAIVKYQGMPLADAPYWVNNPSGDNAYNIISGVWSTEAVDTKLNIRVIKEVNP